MKQLEVAGLVRFERERIHRLIKDRLTGHIRSRCVSGRTKYFLLKPLRKGWLFDAGKSKSPHKDWASSKRKCSGPLESRNTPNKSEAQFEESPHKDRASSKRKSLPPARISVASLSVNHQEAGVSFVSYVGSGDRQRCLADAVSQDDEAAAFFVLDYTKPIGNRNFRQAWARKFKAKPHGQWLTEWMEDFIQEFERAGGRVPGFFFECKREVEKVELPYQGDGKQTPYDDLKPEAVTHE